MKGLISFMAETNAKSKAQIYTINLVLTAMFTAIICVLSQIQIPIQTIPFTLGLLAIFLTGALLKPRYAFLAVLVYLLLGAVGVPVFAGFSGGLHILTGPTGGYLMSFPFVALITSLIGNKFRRYNQLALACGMLVSLLVCYLLGTIWFCYVTGNTFFAALSLCVFPFVLFDLAKIALSLFLSLAVRKAIARNGF